MGLMDDCLAFFILLAAHELLILPVSEWHTTELLHVSLCIVQDAGPSDRRRR